MTVDKMYHIVGKRAAELLHTTGGPIKRAFGDSVGEIEHRIGEAEEHSYYFGKDVGPSCVKINSYSGHLIIRIIGEENGHTLTKSKLEEKFKLTLTEI